MHPYPFDLFGQVPVTWADVEAWLIAVPRIPPDSPRAAHYVKGYDVPGKIAQAKIAGIFDALVNRPAPPPEPFQRFRSY